MQRKQPLFGCFPPISRLLTRHDRVCANNFQKVQILFWSASPEDIFSHVDSESPKALTGDQLPGAFTNTDDDSPIRDTTLELSEDCISNDSHDNDIPRRQVLVESLAMDVAANVQEIIRRIDRRHSSIRKEQADDPDQAGEQTPPERVGITENPMSNRWNAAVRRERDRCEKAKRRENEGTTIDEIWSQALQPAGLDILLSEDVVSDLVCSFQNECHEPLSITAGDLFWTQPLSAPSLSPIFRLAMDDRGKIPESTIPTLLIENNSEIDLHLRDGDLKLDGVSKPSGPASAGLELPESKRDALTDTIQQVLALFVSSRQEDWTLIKGGRANNEDVNSQETAQLEHDEQLPLHSNQGFVAAQELLDYARNNRLMLTSDENNLLLACFLASNVFSEDDILAKSLQLFNEMCRLSLIGLDECGPNSTTYRLLFLALPRRLNAIGEAATICRSLAQASVELNSETLLDAMRVCPSYSDLDTARKLLATAMNQSSTVPLSVGSCIAFIRILKDNNNVKEAIDFYGRIHEVRAESQHVGEGELFSRLIDLL